MGPDEARAIIAEIIRRGEAKSQRWCPHEPTPKQEPFLALDCLESLYGGAAGGGKSDALLMAALLYVDVPGYSAIIFRRTYKQLGIADGLIDRSRAWLSGTAAKWNEQKHRWTFPSSATLDFGHLQHVVDMYNHQGAAYQFVGFDELTQFHEAQYRYLVGRCRRPSVELLK